VEAATTGKMGENKLVGSIKYIGIFSGFANLSEEIVGEDSKIAKPSEGFFHPRFSTC
jgi:hypothetical protein